MADKKRPTAASRSRAAAKSIPLPTVAAAARRRSPFTMLLASAGLLGLGLLCFVLAKGNEVLTFIGFAAFIPGLVIPSTLLSRRLLKKVFLWLPVAALAGVLLFLFSTVVFVTFFFPNETVRQVLQVEMAKSLGRPVAIGGLRVSLLEGVALTGVEIGNKNGAGALAKVKALRLSYKVLPILVGHVVVHEAVLDGAELNIERYANGTSNIDDLLGAGTKTTWRGLPVPDDAPVPAAPGEKGGAAAGGPAAPALPVAISIGELGLKNTALRFTDRGTAGFENRYVLDGLECVLADFNWPAVTPLTISFKFRTMMEELDAAGKASGKTLRMLPGFKGTLTLLDGGGRIAPAGRVVFFAREGLFHGQQFLTRGNALLDELKRDFFRAISGAALGQMDAFEKGLNDKLAALTGDAGKLVQERLDKSKKELQETQARFDARRKQVNDNFSRLTKEATAGGDGDVKGLEAKVRANYDNVCKLFPAARAKLSVDKYVTAARTAGTDLNQRLARSGQELSAALDRELVAVFEAEKARVAKYQQGLQGGFAAQVKKVGDQVRARLRAELADVERAALAYQVKLPFLQKELAFDEAKATLEIDKGRALFKGLAVRGAGWDATADGWYGLLDGSYSIELTLRADKRHNVNELTALFADGDGRLTLTFVLENNGGRLSFKLKGLAIGDRLKGIAVDKAKQFVAGYLERAVSADAVAKALSGDAGGDGAAGGLDARLDALAKGKGDALARARQQYRDGLVQQEKKIAADMKKEAESLAKKQATGFLGKIK